jgi:hypothetical protein
MASSNNVGESTHDGVRTAERVMKICLIVNAILGAFLLIMGFIRGRDFVDLLGSVVLSVAPLYFFYLFSKANRRSHIEKL